MVADTRNVSRIAMEAGAEIIKTRYTGDVAGFRSVVENLRGARDRRRGAETGRDGRIPSPARARLHGRGGRRIIIRPERLAAPENERLINAICAIVHEEESVQSALKLLR